MTRLHRRAAVVPSALLALLLLGSCADQQKGTRSLFAVRERGELYLQRGNYTAALVEFDEYVDRNPGDPKGHFLLGKAFLGLNRPKEAREQIEIAYTSNLESDAVFEALCEALYADKKYDELFVLLRQKTNDPAVAPADYMRLASYCQKTGDIDGAQEAYLQAARLDGGRTVGPQLALADFYTSINDEEEAVKRLRMAYSIDARNKAINDRMLQHGLTAGPDTPLKPAERP